MLMKSFEFVRIAPLGLPTPPRLHGPPGPPVPFFCIGKPDRVFENSIQLFIIICKSNLPKLAPHNLSEKGARADIAYALANCFMIPNMSLNSTNSYEFKACDLQYCTRETHRLQNNPWPSRIGLQQKCNRGELGMGCNRNGLGMHWDRTALAA